MGKNQHGFVFAIALQLLSMHFYIRIFGILATFQLKYMSCWFLLWFLCLSVSVYSSYCCMQLTRSLVVSAVYVTWFLCLSASLYSSYRSMQLTLVVSAVYVTWFLFVDTFYCGLFL